MVADAVKINQIDNMDHFSASVLLVDPQEEVRISGEHSRTVCVSDYQSYRRFRHQLLTGSGVVDNCNSNENT